MEIQKKKTQSDESYKKMLSRVDCICLKCGKKFSGLSKFNRLCIPCKNINENHFEHRGAVYREN